ncbi:MAG: DNA helicase RecQ [Oscillospiraceae bacterium]|nr:DNA helicase RecQ [Oscillospiraceae bacterium]
MEILDTLKQTLKDVYGYDTFRPGQGEVISAILAGRDVLAVMPTGAGKSLCYQLPALCTEGIVLVVSPLISLMHDQVQALVAAGVPAAYINSSLTDAQQRTALQRARAGAYKLIYVAPERLETWAFKEFAARAYISLLAVDEAHCISHWGQDFRQSYLNICSFVAELPRRPVIAAFTATATQLVKDDICRILQLQDPFRVTTGFDRPNLYLDVKQPADRDAALAEFLRRHEGLSGIVYAGTRAAVEEITDFLKAKGFAAARYHAGLPPEERSTNQQAFLYDRVTVMVATNAFGMGIDKSNVSFVVHYNMPKDLESYYQEAGRAGRDGAPADCVLFFGGRDIQLNKFFVDKILEPETDDHLTLAERQTLWQIQKKRLSQMIDYAQSSTCLRQRILDYFGDKTPCTCDNCGVCTGDEWESVNVTVEAQKILSCVKRMGERWGAAAVTEVLRGVPTPRARERGWESLSTFGIMRENPEQEIRGIITFLLQEKCLTADEGQYPTLSLGPKALPVLKGQLTLLMRRRAGSENLAAHRKRRYADNVPRSAPNPELFQVLRGVRAQLAQENRIPAFMIFADATLIDMCAVQPQTPQEMLNVSGVGEVKAQRFGAPFLEAIASFLRGDSALAALPGTPTSAAEAMAPPVPTNGNLQSQLAAAEAALSLSEEPAYLGETVARFSELLTSVGCLQPISGQKIGNRLFKLGYLEKSADPNISGRCATAGGKAAGLETSLYTNEEGQRSWRTTYNKQGQRLLWALVKDYLLGSWV